MNWLAAITLLVLIVAACITVTFVSMLKPTSAGAFLFFVAWLILPYLVMGAALILAWRKEITAMDWQVVAVVVSIVGIIFMTDAIFWHPDAQGAIAVLMTPILQGGASALLLPLASWASRNARS